MKTKDAITVEMTIKNNTSNTPIINSTTNEKLLSQNKKPKSHHRNERILYLGDVRKTKGKYNYPNNYITTSKYTWYNYFPLSLLLQFKRYANIYFLIIMIIQCIPIISPLNPITAIGPFLVVLFISIFREGIEDLAKHKQDEKENNELVERYNYSRQQYEKIPAMNLEVGDIIKLTDDNIIPADCLLLYSSNLTKVAYIETANLDGEKNLKPRFCQPYLFNIMKDSDDYLRIRGKMKYSLPDPDLAKFSGNIMVNKHLIYQVDTKHIVYKGTILKNTKFAIGLVIYTGKNTKIVMNSQKGAPKQSHLEATVNILIGLIFLIQVCLCLVLAVLNTFWFLQNETIAVYLALSVYLDNSVISGLVNFFSYLLLLNTMIPISLIVTIEIVKFAQAQFMQVDVKMYSKVKEKFAQCNSCSLNEELGQIKYIFSDKTGTLTANKLEFKACVIGDELYGMTMNELGITGSELSALKRKVTFSNKERGLRMDYSFPDYEVKQYTVNGKQGRLFDDLWIYSNNHESGVRIEHQGHVVKHFLYCLSLNQTCFVERKRKDGKKENFPKFKRESSKHKDPQFVKGGSSINMNSLQRTESVMSQKLVEKFDDFDIFYKGENPDEIILCDAARHLGFIYLGGDESVANLRLRRDTNGNKEQHENEKWNILKILEFSSARGMMSIIVERNGNIILYSKGANSKIGDLLDMDLGRQPFYDNVSQKALKLSEMGLRVLWIAMKVIDKREWDEWKREYDAGIKTTDNKNSFNAEMYRRIEKGLTLIGATAVEDKLQDKVPETIKELQLAGINIWILTGDNLPTAKNIALMCNLLPKEMDLYEIYESLDKFRAGVIDITDGDPNIFSKEALVEAWREIESFESQYPEAYKFIPGGKTVEENEKLIFEYRERKATLLIGLNAMLKKYKESEKLNVGVLRGVLVESAMLRIVLPDQDFKELKYYTHPLTMKFLEITLNSQAVVCCRVSPMQKALVVRMIKKNIKGAITLSIGDGANDVSMIQEADVGVGIYGEEGTQAAMASDYAIGEFHCLKQLILFHGRINYIRISEMILYFFFKNFIFTIPQFYYSFYNAFSGQTLYDDWFVSLYNMVFTSLPLLFNAIMEQDISENDGKFYKDNIPYTYYQGREGIIFNIKNFVLNILNAIALSILVYFFCNYMMYYSIPLNAEGHVADFWSNSLTQFTTIILIVNYKLLVSTMYHTWISFLVITFMSYGTYFGYFVVSSYFDYSKSNATVNSLFTFPQFYLICFLVSSFCFLFEYALKFVMLNYIDEPITLLRRLLSKSRQLEESSLFTIERETRNKILSYDKKVRNKYKVQRVELEYMRKN